MKYSDLLLMAFKTLWRKRGRHFLTISGVAIGVFSLTLIVSLGEGLRMTIADAVKGDENLRQIRLMSGPGAPNKKIAAKDIVIKGNMSDDRRLRLRRASLNRRPQRRQRGNEKQPITDALMKQLETQAHIQSVRPIISQRYVLSLNDHKNKTSLSCAVDVDSNRYKDRVMTGNYFSSNTAREVILHEYLLYKWGFVSPEQQKQIIGQTLVLKSLEKHKKNSDLGRANPFLEAFSEDLTEDEALALEVLMPKLLSQFDGFQREPKKVSREYVVVGVFREFVTGESFSIVEDVASVRADVYLPHGAARDLYMASSNESEVTYSQAVVVVDDPKNATKIERYLRDNGYTAFSVSGVLEQVDTMLTVVTVIISFLIGIALLVSTLGIVNTTITSVLERRREIGLYKAVGATNGQVMSLFLTESILIGLFGGLFGLGLAVLVSLPGNFYAEKIIAERTALIFENSIFIMPIWLVVLGPVLGMLTAILASIIPARIAAKIDPVKALRYG